MFGLTFLNASILIVSLATLIPLLIHLFVKNKPQKVFFSSLRFLREIIEERKKNMTLNQLLLLILRMLVILFTIFAISRPVLRLPFIKRANFHPPTAVAFILDTSPSMDYVIDQKTQVQHGLGIIKSIQNDMNSRDASILLTSSAMHNSLRSRLHYGLIPDREYNDINFTWTPEPLSKLIHHAVEELEQSRFLHKEIYVISDMQYSELPEELSIPVSFISSFTDSIRVNLSIENISIKKELISGSLQRIAEFDVVNYSPLNQRDQIVRLHLNGTTLSEKMIELSGYERKTDFFLISNEILEWNWGWVEVRNDRFLPDNRGYFTFYSDPEPKIAVVTQSGTQMSDLPRQISILAEIFLGETGRLEYIFEENMQLSDYAKYHFLIFYLNDYNRRTQALITELRRNDIQSMFILTSNMNEATRSFFDSTFALELSSLRNNAQSLDSVTTFNRWHRIIGDFDFNSQLNLQATPVFYVNSGVNNSPLVNTTRAPLIIENKDIIVNINFSVSGQNFLSHPSFPIIIYRSFSWISKYDGGMNQYILGEGFRNNQGILINTTGDEYDASITSFRFNEPGIWSYIDISGELSYIAVNMFDYENQSRHNPMIDIDIDNVSILGADFQNNVLQQDKGNEIWKILLWAVVIFLTIEMLLVLILQKK